MSGEDDEQRRSPESGEFTSNLLARVVLEEQKSVPDQDSAFKGYLDAIANVAASAKQLATDASACAARAESTASRAETIAGHADKNAGEACTRSKTTFASVGGAGAAAALMVGLCAWWMQGLSQNVNEMGRAAVADRAQILHLEVRIAEGTKALEATALEKRVLEERVRDLEERVRWLGNTPPALKRQP